MFYGTPTKWPSPWVRLVVCNGSTCCECRPISRVTECLFHARFSLLSCSNEHSFCLDTHALYATPIYDCGLLLFPLSLSPSLSLINFSTFSVISIHNLWHNSVKSARFKSDLWTNCSKKRVIKKSQNVSSDWDDPLNEWEIGSRKQMTPAYSTHLHNGTLQWNYPLEQTHLNPVYISGGAAPYTEFESLNGDKVTNGKKQIVIVCEGKNTFYLLFIFARI